MRTNRIVEVTIVVALLLSFASPALAAATLGPWRELSATPLPRPLALMSTFTHSGYVYVLGGKTSFPYGDRAEVYRAEICPDGTLGSWEELASLPEARTSGAAAVAGDYVFYTGGGYAGNSQDEVFRSRLRSDGTLETWIEVEGAALPDLIVGHDIVYIDNCLFLIGGFATPIGGHAYMVDHVYRAEVDSLTGDLSSGWQDLGPAHSLPQGVYTHSTVLKGDYIYVIGGYAHEVTPSVQRTVYRARITQGADSPTLEPWEVLDEAQLPVGLYALDAAFARGSIFITGGSTGDWVDGAQNKVYRSVVDATTGDLAPWEELTSAVLPERVISHGVVSTENSLVNLGGTTQLAAMTSNVYVAPIVDRAPPETEITLYGSVGSDGWYTSSVAVTLSATDESGGSGVAYTEYSLDGGATWTAYTEPFTIAQKGVTAILARSADNAVNLEDPPVGAEVKVALDCQVLFHEDFSADLGQWTLFGSPLSYIDTGVGHLAPSLQTHGDGSYASGITSLQGFYLAPGTTIGHHGQLERIDWGNSYALIAYRDWSISENDASKSALWFGCGGSYHGNFTCQLHVWNGTTYEAKLDIPIITPGSFHRFKTEILDDMRVAFYIDDMSLPVWTSSSSLDTSYGSGPIVIAGRKGWVDNVTVFSCDVTPPTTTIGVGGTLGDNDWFVSPVTVTLSATDEPGGSGVAYTQYSVDGGSWISYTAPINIAAEGPSTILARSADNADNVESPPVSEEVKLDSTPPTIVGSRSPDPNADGWNNEDVTVHFECSDATSGVASCAPDTVLSAEGEGQSVLGIATDSAGNTATATVADINIDKSGPNVEITDLCPNPADESETPDLVAEVSDALSGVQSAEWCAESPSLACVWQPMVLTGAPGDSPRTASAAVAGLPPGFYSIRVKGQDQAGNWSDSVERSLVVYVTATVDIDPNTLNLKSKGNWVTAYIELPETYDVADIDVGSVLLEDTIPAASHPTNVGDQDGDGVPDLMVKFSRPDLIVYLKANGLTSGDVELTVTGYVESILFVGTDSIRVK